jgi:hypothetical protein
MFVPIMWVDNPLSLVGGRETYGYNKNWGEIGIPTPDVEGPPTFTLNAYGGDFGKGKGAGEHKLIEMTPPPTTPFGRADVDPVWQNLETLVTVAERELLKAQLEPLGMPGLALPDSPLADVLLKRSLPMFFLRQFRSVMDGRLASQQQVTDGGTTMKPGMRWARLPGTFDLTLHALGSHPVTQRLGVQEQPTDIAFEVRMDFVLEDGRVLWEGASA